MAKVSGFVSLAIILTVTALAPLAQAQTATVQDLNAMEQRVNTQFTNLTVQTGTVLSQVNARSTTIDNVLATMQSVLGQVNTRTTAIDAAMVALTNVSNQIRAQVLATGAINASALSASLDSILVNLNASRGETLTDHVDIYGITQMVTAEQVRLRSDMDALNRNVTEGFIVTNSGNEETFVVADRAFSKLNIMGWAVTFLVITQALTLMAVTKRPKALFRRLRHEAAKTETPNVFVAPECPAEGEPSDDGGKLTVGKFFTCPVAKKCPVGAQCKTAAVDLATKAAVEGTTTDEPEGEEEEVEQVVPKQMVNIVTRKSPLEGFGGA